MSNMKSLSHKIRNFLLNNLLLVFVIILWIFASFLSKKFLTTNNLLNLLKTASMKGTLAVGMTVAIICGQIDMSVSSTVAMTGVVLGMCFAAIPNPYVALVVGILVMLFVGVAMASAHSFFVIKYNMPPMIVTMATMKLLYGFCGLLCNGYPITTFPTFYSKLGGAKLFGWLPSASIWFIVSIIVVSFILSRTKFGRDVYATGGNLQAAKLSGINVNRTRWFAYFLVQIVAIAAGIILSSQVRAGNHSYAQDWGLDIISSVIIGGTSFAGGVGTVPGTVVGMILVSTINNVLTLLNVSTFYQYLCQGALMLFAVVINTIKDSALSKRVNA